MIAACLTLAGCGRPAPERGPGPLRIVVSIAPLEGLVRALAPDAEITLLVPAGVSEHGYELTSGDVARIRRADLVVGVGLGLEPRLEQVLRAAPTPGRDAVWFAAVLTPEDLGVEACDHDHDHHHHHHEPTNTDPHLWLDPVLVERFIPVLASAIDTASRRASPDEPAGAADRAGPLAERIRSVHEQCLAAMTPLAGRAIVTHHASHGRFAARYGLRIAATIRVSETSEPTPGQVQAAVNAIRHENVPAVFVEPQFDSTTAARIAQAAGVRVITLDPMGDGDWFALMHGTIQVLTEALGDAPQPAAGPA